MISPYLIVYLLIVVLTIVSLANKKYVNVCYAVAFALMTIFLALRYGQGTDFPAYEMTFELAPEKFDLTNAIYFSNTVSVEYGWWIINNVFKSLGFSFVGLSIFFSIVDMLLLNRFIRVIGFTRYKVLVLLLAFPTLYLTYFFSAFRQAFVMAMFLGIMLPLFFNKKYVSYLLLAFTLFFIHRVAIVTLLVFFVDYLSVKQYKYLLIPSFLLGIVASKVLVPILVAIGKSAYVESLGISVFSLLERLFMLFIILYLYRKFVEQKNGNETELLDRILKFYLFGTCFYLICIMLPLVGSRICIIFKVVEIWLIPQMLPSATRERRVQLFAIILVVTCAMTYKNMGTMIREGSYNDTITIKSFPYVTIFNQEEIFALRDSTYYHVDTDYIKSRF